MLSEFLQVTGFELDTIRMYWFLQNFQVFTILPAFLVIFCAIIFVRKPDFKKCIPSESKRKRILSYESGPLVDYFKIDDEFKELTTPQLISKDCLDLVKQNYLDLLNNKELQSEAEVNIRKYGVGSCGPRGFYGTIDIHLTLEKRLAEFMQVEAAVLYSYGFSTISSAIAAYCKRSDIIFCDERISFCAVQGMLAAKSKVVYFKHNDTEDLEMKLKEYEHKEQQTKKLFRKFLIVEAIYKATGKLCPLPKLMELREKYKLRIFIDESLSFGVLGENGRGITEHFNINKSDVDMIMASMEGAIASVAGFCAGSAFIIDHQRLSGIGYVFSASLPPFLSHVSICALKLFEENSHLFKALQSIALSVDQSLRDNLNCLIISDPISPLKVITTRAIENRPENMRKIRDICDKKNAFVLLAGEYIQFNVNITIHQEDIDRIIKTLKEAFKECNVID